MPDSISRQFARWASNLTYDDLPASVVEKVKSLLLHHLLGAVFASDHRRVKELVDLVRLEDARPDGASILGDDLGAKVTRQGAVLANSEILNIARLNDSFRMITHPGPVLIAVAFANTELGRKTPRDMVTALACGYEFQCRLADDFVPSVSAHGFRPAPIFSTMGAAMVAGKLFDLDEDGLVAAIGAAANSASGLNESRRDARTGGNENSIHQMNAARQGMFAAVMARTGRIRGSEWVIEGPAGFYAAFAGSRDGRLSYVFTGPREIDLESITEGLGTDYKLRHVMFRIYPVGGFNQPIIELMTEMKKQHAIDADEIDEVVVSVNYLETLYPSPEFPRVPDPSHANVGSIQYFLAHTAVNGGFPVIGGRTFGPTGMNLEEDERVLEFMRTKVRLIGVPDQPMFSPRISVRMNDGATYSDEYPYERMEWTFDQLAQRLQGCVPGLPGGQARLDTLIDTVGRFHELPSLLPIFEAVRHTRKDTI